MPGMKNKITTKLDPAELKRDFNSISVEEAALQIPCSKDAAYRMVKDGTLASFKVGQVTRVPVSGLLSLLQIEV